MTLFHFLVCDLAYAQKLIVKSSLSLCQHFVIIQFFTVQIWQPYLSSMLLSGFLHVQWMGIKDFQPEKLIIWDKNSVLLGETTCDTLDVDDLQLSIFLIPGYSSKSWQKLQFTNIWKVLNLFFARKEMKMQAVKGKEMLASSIGILLIHLTKYLEY